MSDVVVLCYHGVSDDWPCDIAISPSRLGAQVGWFLDRGYVPTTFTEAVLRPPARRTLAVTFDDAYRSVLERGRPVLAAMDVPATVFVPTAFVGREPRGWEGTDMWADGPWADEIAVMGWGELGELAAAGWEVGGHTRTHPRLTELDGSALDDELRRAREEIDDRLGAACSSIAYPYGATDRRVARAAERAGYVAGGGLLPDRLSPSDPLLFPRLGVGRGWSDATVRRRARRGFRRLQGSRSWPLVVRAMALKRAADRIRRSQSARGAADGPERIRER